mmetsp:Transcript_30921/g.103012  ORF Transcript_30921/g.103012 Transcript_30921/m.103012 type:complete len:252 (-) Transcript_30921:11342-12097(-)
MFSPLSSRAFSTRFLMSSSMPGRYRSSPYIRDSGSSMIFRSVASTEVLGAAMSAAARWPRTRHLSSSSMFLSGDTMKGFRNSCWSSGAAVTTESSPAKTRSNIRSLSLTGRSVVEASQSLSFVLQGGFRSTSSAARRPGSWQRAISKPAMSFFCCSSVWFLHFVANLSKELVAVDVIISTSASFASLYSFVPSAPEKGFHFGTKSAPMNFSKSMSWASRQSFTQGASQRGCSPRRRRKKEMPRCLSTHFKR